MAKSKVKNNESYINQVKGELKKVKWPTKKEMLKYTLSTLIFIIFFAVFFYGIDTLFALFKGWIG